MKNELFATWNAPPVFVLRTYEADKDSTTLVRHIVQNIYTVSTNGESMYDATNTTSHWHCMYDY